MAQEAEERNAEAIMASLLPDIGERVLVLKRLVETLDCAERVVAGSCAVTLYPNGFRLNVGQVETLVFMDGRLRVNLHGSIPLSGDLKSFLHAADYKSVSQPQSAFVGSISEFQRWEPSLIRAHHAFVKLAAFSPAGKPRKGTPFARSHSDGLLSYARRMAPGRDELEHFIAYHSEKVMGCEYEAHGELNFLSSKIGLLKKAIGNKIWVVNGARGNGRTQYALSGVYIARSIELEGDSSPVHRMRGEGTEFRPPVLLNEFDWFPGFLKSQSNFSLGFNRISDPGVISGLMALESSTAEAGLPDIDSPSFGLEGARRLVPHLRRERDRNLVQAKKAAVLLQQGCLICEACGFDFSKVYGELGRGFCEIHHRTPLSSSEGAVRTALGDLAVLCSNCHRMIHRTEPMPSVEDFSRICTL